MLAGGEGVGVRTAVQHLGSMGICLGRARAEEPEAPAALASRPGSFRSWELRFLWRDLVFKFLEKLYISKILELGDGETTYDPVVFFMGFWHGERDTVQCAIQYEEP